jgi:hypothetical protein
VTLRTSPARTGSKRWSTLQASGGPTGWVKGEGFVSPPGDANPLKAPPRFVDIGEEYVR